LLVEAFNRLALPLDVIGEGTEHARLERIAGPTIRLLGHVDDQDLTARLESARAFVFAAEEDFGIAPVEAMSAGTPVIAWSRGGCGETVVEGKSGFLFREQSVESICSAVRAFLAHTPALSAADIATYAQKFSRARFQTEMAQVINESLAGRKKPIA
jgi:glycosyltransferase involved in cell wall biosynthesis